MPAMQSGTCGVLTHQLAFSSLKEAGKARGLGVCIQVSQLYDQRSKEEGKRGSDRDRVHRAQDIFRPQTRLSRKTSSLCQGLPDPGRSPPRVLPLLLSPLAPAQVIQEPQQETGLTTASLEPTWASRGPLAWVLAFLRHRLFLLLYFLLLLPTSLGLGVHQPSARVLPLGDSVPQPGGASTRVLPLLLGHLI